MGWTKHEYICTECDSLMEITTYWRDEFVNPPKCPCPHQAITRVNKYTLPVTDITPANVVKINTNPYN